MSDRAFTPRRLLVTGGAGFIGSAFVEGSLSSGRPAAAALLERLVVLDGLTYAGRREHLAGFDADPRFAFVHGDIADRPLVERLFGEHDFDAVVHLAAESHVDRSIADAAAFVRTNVVGTFTLLDVAKAAWRGAAVDLPRRFLHVSSDEVYGALSAGSPPTARFNESSRYAPSSPYAASKASSDHFAHAYFVTHAVPIIVTHSSNNFGPRQYPEKLIPLCIANAVADRPLPLYGDGRQIREWLYVDDHVAALWRALTFGRPGETYDFGGAAELENRDVVSRIADAVDAALGRPPGVSRRLVTHVADRPGHDFRYTLDSTKAHRELGWKPQIAFEEGLARTVRWFVTPPAS
jgi:dTDP-glucose 4,6-dehydratase